MLKFSGKENKLYISNPGLKVARKLARSSNSSGSVADATMTFSPNRNSVSCILWLIGIPTLSARLARAGRQNGDRTHVLLTRGRALYPPSYRAPRQVSTRKKCFFFNVTHGQISPNLIWKTV